MMQFRKPDSFFSDRSGQFAVMAALLAVPLLAAVGLSIDYMSINQVKTRLRDSNDAAALFAAAEYRRSGALPSKEKVVGHLLEGFAKAEIEYDPLVTRYELKDDKVYLDSQVDEKMMFMTMFGYDKVQIPGKSVVNVGKDEFIEIALSLDTTYSMLAGSGTSSTDLDPVGTGFPVPIANVTRLDALKFSASQFVNTVFGNDGGKGMVRVSVVPFADYVNVGVERRGASWLDVAPDQGATGETCYKAQSVIGSTNCREVTVTIDGVQFPSTQCDPVYGPEQTYCYPTGASTWYGCVGSRNEPLNLRDASPSSKFKGIHNIWCAQPLQTLSGDKPSILTTITNLSASGNTYIPEGIMWGMRTLSQLEPFTDVKAPTGTKTVRKIMVLMTDGDNQAAADIPLAPTHHGIVAGQLNYAEEREKTDSWTLEACNEAKSAGIEVFTISFGTDISAQARSVVKSCASDPAHYFDAKDGEALNSAFQAIAANVGKFYLSG